MGGRARRIAVILVAAALVLSAGRWLSVFLTERLWESSVSEAVAVAGARRALLGLTLELLVLVLASAWFVCHLTIAARVALPDRAPPERPQARLWPARLPRWTLYLTGVILGVMIGTGAGRWLDDLLLAFDGVRLGVTDPLLGVDLGFFVGRFPLWLELQRLVADLSAIGLAAVLAIHAAGGALAIVDRRIWISPKVRGHLAFLLGVLAAAVAWGSVLEEYRLAAGLRGPLVASEFLLRTLLSQIQAGIGAAAAVGSILWWLRVRAVVAVSIWSLLALSLVAGRILPLGSVAATTDDGWRTSARRLDSVAFSLGDVEGSPLGLAVPAAELTPTLWDEAMIPLAAASDSSTVTSIGRGWVTVSGRPRPVWFALREGAGQTPALLALADDQVSASGGILTWRQGDTATSPGSAPYRELSLHTLRPTSPAVDVSTEAPGIALDAWTKRLVLAWALQEPAALSAPAGTRLGWLLDPVVRLRAAAPFAQWTRPRPRIGTGGLVWTSDGLLTSVHFPSSTRIDWTGGSASMLRSAFLGTVNASTGVVRIFRRDPSDSLAAAWARITGQLIEAPAAIPPELRSGDPYPEELLLAQARVLEGPAWQAGRLERGGDGSPLKPTVSAGGSDALVPLVREVSRQITSFLLARRTASGDSVRLIRLDSTLAVESSSALVERWKLFPFQQALFDSVRAAGGRFEPGRVRHAVARDGIAAYQPAWSVPAAGRAQLVLVNVTLGRKLGTGRSFAEAWRNFRGEVGPLVPGTGAEALLEEARRWMRHADSAFKRGDFQEMGRALQFLRELLEPNRKR